MKKGDVGAQIGRTKGGMNTKLHAVVEARRSTATARSKPEGRVVEPRMMLRQPPYPALESHKRHYAQKNKCLTFFLPRPACGTRSKDKSLTEAGKFYQRLKYRLAETGPIADGGRKQNTAAGQASRDGITSLEADMPAGWSNIQIVERGDPVGRAVTVFSQSDGTHLRYVLGNGRKVEANADGTFLIPGSAMELQVIRI